MLKKSLLAAAVASVVSIPTFAMEVSSDADFTAPIAGFTTNVLASVTKQAVLDITTLEESVNLYFDNTNAAAPELKNNGYIVFEILGQGEFNPNEIKNWLLAVCC
ncbi:hypothetical protein D8T52_00770 [Vibrio vulnificus]|uniref:hypothetical protein n=1 Tax=Vibrio vulnificus TaxID=672 RepID=UPI001029B765|nr:hypothetical protein [Vibrio vulnificus]RZP84200.1 hypothetical protein D8T52_00770 [Vibrio vulnificus]